MEEQKKRLVKKISLEAAGLLMLFLASILVFAFIAHEVVGEQEEQFDDKVFYFLHGHSSPAIIDFFRIITFFGSMYFLIPAYVIVIGYLFARKRKRDAIDIAIVASTSFTLMYLLKEYFKRHRPPFPILTPLTNFSFPSGHSLCGFIFCGILIYLVTQTKLNKTWQIIAGGLLILLFLLVGISRIVLRYHYATDVIAGFCIAFAWLSVCLWLRNKLKMNWDRKKNR